MKLHTLMLSGVPFYCMSLLYSVCWFHFLGPPDLFFFFPPIWLVLFSCVESFVIAEKACISRSENPACEGCRWNGSVTVPLPAQGFWQGEGDRMSGGHQWCTWLTGPLLQDRIQEKEILLKGRSQKDGHCGELRLFLTLGRRSFFLRHHDLRVMGCSGEHIWGQLWTPPFCPLLTLWPWKNSLFQASVCLALRKGQ